jgi:hypothetical protein
MATASRIQRPEGVWLVLAKVVFKKMAERLNETQQKFADVQPHYGENHPEYRKTANQVLEVVPASSILLHLY